METTLNKNACEETTGNSDEICISESQIAPLLDALYAVEVPSRSEAIAMRRQAALDAAKDPANWHPLVGNGHWLVSDEELTATLQEAEIANDFECGPITFIYGWLSEAFGSHAFTCVYNGATGEHLLFVPSKID